MAAVDKVVVVGGGVGGLTTALALQRAGVEVEVHEKFDHLQEHATGFTIWSYAVGHLSALGLEPDALDEIGARIQQTDIHGQDGELIESTPVGDASRKLGQPTYDMSRGDLQRKLIDALERGTVRMGSECVGVEQDDDTASALLDGGARASGDLVVGADGIHSALREPVAGHFKLDYSGYRSSGALIDFTHDDLPAAHHVEIWGRGSKAGVADVGGGRARWYVTYRSPAGEDPFSRQQILEHLDGWWPLVRDAVQATGDEQLFSTEVWDLEPLPTWHSGRVVLIGDAAHATTPFAAMGACMTIEDSLELTRLLTGRDSLEEALDGFQERRKALTEKEVQAGRKMGKLAQLHNPILYWLRNYVFEHAPADKLEQVAEDMASGKGSVASGGD
jgi:FAD-dependent urate hydroxylase